MTVNAAWLQQVLRDRGVQRPEIKHIEQYLSELDSEQLSELEGTLRAVRFGTDQVGALESIIAGIKLHGSNVQDAMPQDVGDGDMHATVARPSGLCRRATLRTHGFHIYAGKAAMKVEIDFLRGDAPQLHTLSIDVAPAKQEEARAYDWSRKIPFQFTLRELPALAALLLGYSSSPLTLKNHGPHRDKSLHVEDQGPLIFIKLQQGSRVLALPVDPADTWAWAGLCLLALRWNTPHLDTTAHLELLRRLAGMRDSQPTL